MARLLVPLAVILALFCLCAHADEFVIDGVKFIVGDKAKLNKPVVIKNSDGTVAAKITPKEYKQAVKGKGDIDGAADSGVQITLGDKSKLQGKTVIVNENGQTKVVDEQSNVNVGKATVEGGQASTYIILEDNAKLKGRTDIKTVGGDAVTAVNGGSVTADDTATFSGGDATTTVRVAKDSTLSGSRTIETRGGSVATVDGDASLDVGEDVVLRGGDASSSINTVAGSTNDVDIVQKNVGGDVATITAPPKDDKKENKRRNSRKNGP